MTSFTPDRPAVPARGWLPAFAGAGLIWGTSFMFIKVAVDDVPPVWLAFARNALGALTLLVLLLSRGQRLPGAARLWARIFVFAIFGSTVPFIMFGYAEQHVSSVLAGIWNGTTPLTTLVVTLLILRFARAGDRPRRQQIAGLLLGFAGVLVVLGVWHGVGGGSLVGQLQLLVAVSCYGIAMNYSRRIMTSSSITPLQLSAGQTMMSTLQLAIIAPLLNGAPPDPTGLPWRSIGSVAALGILGTGLAFVFNFHVISVAGVTTGSMVTYLPPVIAAIAGVLVLKEHLSWNEPVGGVIVLAGVGVAQGVFGRLRRSRSRSEPDSTAVEPDRRLSDQVN
jgi:drug/metabolite transporter (DMT)-like permease